MAQQVPGSCWVICSAALSTCCRDRTGPHCMGTIPILAFPITFGPLVGGDKWGRAPSHHPNLSWIRPHRGGGCSLWEQHPVPPPPKHSPSLSAAFGTAVGWHQPRITQCCCSVPQFPHPSSMVTPCSALPRRCHNQPVSAAPSETTITSGSIRHPNEVLQAIRAHPALSSSAGFDGIIPVGRITQGRAKD